MLGLLFIGFWRARLTQKIREMGRASKASEMPREKVNIDHRLILINNKTRLYSDIQSPPQTDAVELGDNFDSIMIVCR